MIWFRKLNVISGMLLLILLIASCNGHKRERFNYTLIKSKLDLTPEQVEKFDEITTSHTQKARKAYESNKGNHEEVKNTVAAIFQEQDAKIKALLSREKFAVYAKEIKIEREGREKYNMTLIRNKLELDSVQTVKYDRANEAFYQLLLDNHDNYHGKPDVYLQYYQEIDVNRQEAFKKLMTETQYEKYQKLAEEYKLGKSEAY